MGQQQINPRLNAEEKINELEDRVISKIRHRVKRIEINYWNTSEPQDDIKQINIHVFGVLEELKKVLLKILQI